MDLFANDLSFHGQFHDISSFRDAFGRLMAMREVSRRYGRDLYCSRSLMSANTTRGATMQQVFQRFPEAQRRSALGWMTRSGPFWDDVRRHGPDDWLESQGEVVTESAVGEAAYCNMYGLACGLVSVTPSNWEFFTGAGELAARGYRFGGSACGSRKLVGCCRPGRTIARCVTTAPVMERCGKNRDESVCGPDIRQ